MFPWKRKAEQPSAAGDDLPGFTRAQRARLTRLRAHLRSHAPDLTCGPDARRLQFARWLVRHGRLSEGMDAQEAARASQLSQAPHLVRQSWWWTLVYLALALLGVAAQWLLTSSGYTLDAYSRDVALA